MRFSFRISMHVYVCVCVSINILLWVSGQVTRGRLFGVLAPHEICGERAVPACIRERLPALVCGRAHRDDPAQNRPVDLQQLVQPSSFTAQQSDAPRPVLPDLCVLSLLRHVVAEASSLPMSTLV